MGRHLCQHPDQEDDRLVRLRPHGTLAQCWHGGDYHQLVSSWMLPSSSLHRSSCPSALATSSQCLGRWTTMGSTWQSLEDNEDLFLGKKSLKSHPFFWKCHLGMFSIRHRDYHFHPAQLTAWFSPQQLFDWGARPVHWGHADARAGADDAGVQASWCKWWCRCKCKCICRSRDMWCRCPRNPRS